MVTVINMDGRTVVDVDQVVMCYYFSILTTEKRARLLVADGTLVTVS